ncbi:MAG TPA: hypothetical protein VLZ50_15935 [Terracidiphilus sp.]|nr:hypothetical protein [Terracidiphilus sp.]
MAGSPFTRTDPELLPILEELRRREPIFHIARFGASLDDFIGATAPDFWEVGASGRRYSREFILRTLGANPPCDADSAGWQCSDFALRRLGPDTFLLTYTLLQVDRLTRRATLWQRASEGWRILYHQGTVAASAEDDVMPA